MIEFIQRSAFAFLFLWEVFFGIQYNMHCSPIVHMNHMKLIFQDLHFICKKKGPKKLQSFFSLLSPESNDVLKIRRKRVGESIKGVCKTAPATTGLLTIHVSPLLPQGFFPEITLVPCCLLMMSISGRR